MPDGLRHVYFLSDGTGITAETLGSTLLTQFPQGRFYRTTVPFISTTAKARSVVNEIDQVALRGEPPLVFSTAVNEEIRNELAKCNGVLVDLIGAHVQLLEEALRTKASHQAGQAHGLGNALRYQSRMMAVEYAMEHDDGQSLRALEKAEVILIAPSRCGKTPSTMYLALQHGVYAANFPLVDEDFPSDSLPVPLQPYRAKCFGLTSNPMRLSQVRAERRPGSEYASLRQCGIELRSAERMYVAHDIPHVNSASMSVEEISAVVLERMGLRH
ncbi:pyruvate, water dikinase regulatory protein [Pseudarthrobacter sp. P1]|uniref:pyruvate, water dikinase regulatory protein n=1 Tax=Pseudarthrobacter sp. P1 TaxID=3418418 RepID=UPI003CF84B15